MPLDEAFLPGFFVAFLARFVLDVLVVEGLLLLPAPDRFLAAVGVFLPEVFFVILLVAPEVTDFFEEDRLLAFFAVDPLRAFVVGMSPPYLVRLDFRSRDRSAK